MGPYTETVVATRVSDTDNDPADKGWHIYGQLIALLYCFIGISASVSFILYFTWDYIGLIAGMAVVGLGFVACWYYGNNNSVFGRHVKIKLSDDERRRIRRRLSGKRGEV